MKLQNSHGWELELNDRHDAKLIEDHVINGRHSDIDDYLHNLHGKEFFAEGGPTDPPTGDEPLDIDVSKIYTGEKPMEFPENKGEPRYTNFHNPDAESIDENYIFDKINTAPYSDNLGAIRNLGHRMLYNEAYNHDKLYDKDGDYNLDYEALGLAMGDKIPQKYINESKYKPSTSKDENAKYYSVGGINKQAVIDRYFDIDEGVISDKNTALRVYNNLDWNDQSNYEVDPIQKHTESASEDENGKYISYYDKYDLANKWGEKVLGVGKDGKYIEYYDRMYYDDVPMTDKEYDQFTKRYDKKIKLADEQYENVMNDAEISKEVKSAQLKRIEQYKDRMKHFKDNKLKRVVKEDSELSDKK